MLKKKKHCPDVTDTIIHMIFVLYFPIQNYDIC